MLNQEALKLLNPNKQSLSIRVDGKLIIVQADDNWIALSRPQAIDFIQSLANAVNSCP